MEVLIALAEEDEAGTDGQAPPVDSHGQLVSFEGE